MIELFIGAKDENATIPVRMTKVKGGKALRTSSVEGHTSALPEVGKQFVMWGTEAFDPDIRKMAGSGRRVNTSPIVNIETVESQYRCTTESGSVYLIESLEG